MNDLLTIYEVGPRDGLQNQPTLVSGRDKTALIGKLVAAGLGHIEATSFVSPRAVPQMADAPDVLAAAMNNHSEVRFSALVVNPRGYHRARAAGAQSIAVVAVLSETLAGKNNRMSAQDSVAMAADLAGRAHREGVACRVYLAPAWVCPYHGAVPQPTVLAAADRMWQAGVGQLALADTIGHAHPLEVGRLCEKVASRCDASRLAVHLHDTQALGLANAAAALSAGIRTVDASIGGLGGCPFAPGAAGNLATEDLVLMAEKMGFSTGVDLDSLWRAVDFAQALVGRDLGGRTAAWWRSHRRATPDSPYNTDVAGCGSLLRDH